MLVRPARRRLRRGNNLWTLERTSKLGRTLNSVATGALAVLWCFAKLQVSREPGSGILVSGGKWICGRNGGVPVEIGHVARTAHDPVTNDMRIAMFSWETLHSRALTCRRRGRCARDRNWLRLSNAAVMKCTFSPAYGIGGVNRNDGVWYHSELKRHSVLTNCDSTEHLANLII